MDFPRTVEEITPKWLTQVLRESADIGSAQVRSFDIANIGDDQGVAGDVRRLHLTYDSALGGDPASVIAKLPRNDLPSNPVIAAFGVRETRFYQELSSESGMRTPTLYTSELDDQNGDFILLLEDLNSLRSVDQTSGCDYVDAHTALQAVAAMHAKWWNEPSLQGANWLLDRPFPNTTELAQERFVQDIDQFMDIAGAHVPTSIETVASKLGPKLHEVVNGVTGPPFTLVHGDYSLSNIFFSDQTGDHAGVVPFDWALAGRLKGASDVAFFLMESLTTGVRREHEERLLSDYHEALVAGGVSGYSLDELWTDVRIAALPHFAKRVIVTIRIGARMLESENGRKRAQSTWERLQTIIDWNCEEVIPK
jgi:hypothetical protein